MSTDIRKPLPDVQDIDHAPFWQGTEKGKLHAKRCTDCGRYQWPPRLGCPYCGSGKVDWVGVSRSGKVFSWTVIYRSQTPGFEAETPYAVGTRRTERCRGCSGHRSKPVNCPIGLPLKAGFLGQGSVHPFPRRHRPTLVNWQPTENAGAWKQNPGPRHAPTGHTNCGRRCTSAGLSTLPNPLLGNWSSTHPALCILPGVSDPRPGREEILLRHEGPAHHEGGKLLAARRDGHPTTATSCTPGAAASTALDVLRIDVHAAADDHVLGAAGEMQEESLRVDDQPRSPG